MRHGSVSSPVLFGYYMEELTIVIAKRDIGCKVADHFTGILVYADDIVLLAPRRRAMQLMAGICSSYAGEHNLLFSTNASPSKSKSNSKCLIFLTVIQYSNTQNRVCDFVLNGQGCHMVEAVNILVILWTRALIIRICKLKKKGGGV